MSHRARFRKIAQEIDNSDILKKLESFPIDIPGITSEETPPSNGDSGIGKSKSNKETYFQKLLNIDGQDMASFKESLPYLLALFGAPDEKIRYKPSAFLDVLEKNKHKGYDNTSVSEGAFQPTDSKILKQVEKFRKSPPANLKDLRTKEPVKLDNINVPNSSDRYKSMRSKLYGKSAEDHNLKFVKTSQNTQVNDFNKLLPEWDISDVLKSMSSVANKTGIADAEKQQSMINILSQYEKSIAPLSQFLDKNDIKYK